MDMHKVTFTEILLKVAGLSTLLSDAAFGDAIKATFGKYAGTVMAILGAAVTISGAIVHYLNNVIVQEVPVPMMPVPVSPTPPITPESHTD